MVKLLEIGGRPVTLLDDDIVRKNLSSELGFSKKHRDINIRSIGFVASEITKNGGIAICAPTAPYHSVYKEIRKTIEAVGGFVLINIAASLEIREQRGHEGLCAEACAGVIKEFTGISDPYEPPNDPAMTINTTILTPEECVQQIILHLEKEGYISPDSQS
jgi:sulfate adenylyltransferase